MYLFTIDYHGTIKQVFYKADDIFEQTRNLYRFFSAEAQSKLKQVLAQRDDSATLKILCCEDKKTTVILKHTGVGYLTFLSYDTMSKNLKRLVEIFLLTLSQQLMLAPQNLTKESEFFLENMQRLNNELINKTRDIEKMNQRLNRLNALLNDRLIKDPLTGLVSRYQFRDEMVLAIQKNAQSHGIFCFIDIDDFKLINDTYGHQLGDEYLVKFSERLLKLPFDNTVIMRIAGDEFGVFIYGLKTADHDMCKHIWDTFNEVVVYPIELNGKTYPLSISIGFAIYGKDTSDINELFDFADFAMYSAKRSGKNRPFIFDKDKYNAHKKTL